MKVLPAIVVTALFVISISAGSALADDTQTSESHVNVLPFPSINLNVTQSAFYNLSFLGLILHTQSGDYHTIFNKNHWNFIEHNNTTYYYTGIVQLTPGVGEDSSPLSSAISANPSESEDNSASINAGVNITLSALNYQLSNFQINNTSSPSGSNYLFPNYSVMEISISVTFQNAIQGPGNLYLLQLIKSSNNSKSAVQYYFGNVTHNLTDRMHGEHRGLQVLPDRVANTSAFYWWNNTFQLNGVNQTMKSRVGLDFGGILIAFDFPFNNSLKKIYEDPYIGVPNSHLFQSKLIQQSVTNLVAYLIVHAEFFGVGAAAGIGILGISYSFYRKRKF